MNTEVKTKWLEALRSGEYNQTKGTLKREPSDSVDPEGHCCLGVLCELFSKDWETIRNDVQSEGLIPTWVREPAGLTITNEITLSRMNDIHGKSFEQIADYIEENL